MMEAVCPSAQSSPPQVEDSSVCGYMRLKATSCFREVPRAERRSIIVFSDAAQVSYSNAYHEPSIPYICWIRPGDVENHLWSSIHEGLDSDTIMFLAKACLAKIAQNWNTQLSFMFRNELAKPVVDDPISVNFAR